MWWRCWWLSTGIIPDWFVASKMLEKNSRYFTSQSWYTLFGNDSSKVTFFANEMLILYVDLNKINLDDDNNFYEDYPETNIHVKVLAWY